MALGAQGQQFQQMLAQNPLLAAMAMSGGGGAMPPLPPTSSAAGLPGMAGGMPPGLFPGIPGLSPPGMPAHTEQSSMLNAMTQLQSLFMMNNPATAASSQNAMLQSQVS